MQLGFGLITCQRYPGDPRTDADLYREAIELAVEAETLGLDSVWLSEHHFLDDAYMPSLLPTAAAIAARTSRIGIGTGVVLGPLYDSVRLAEDAATVDLISDGRLILGLGAGWREEEFAGLGVEQRRLGARLDAQIEVLRQAWSDGVVTAEGRPGVSVTPKPARPGGPPIWLGAHAEPAVRRAGRLADGFLGSRATPEVAAQQVAWIREELERRGRDPGTFTFALHFLVFPWEGSDAWELVRAPMHYISWKYADMAAARGRTGAPALPPPPTAEAEAALRAQSLVGAPAEVAADIIRFREVAGPDLHFVGRLYYPGLPLEVQRETLRLFAHEVAPAVRSA